MVVKFHVDIFCQYEKVHLSHSMFYMYGMSGRAQKVDLWHHFPSGSDNLCDIW